MNIALMLKADRIPRKQKGQRIETRTAFFLRYYTTTTNGTSAPATVSASFFSPRDTTPESRPAPCRLRSPC